MGGDLPPLQIVPATAKGALGWERGHGRPRGEGEGGEGGGEPGVWGEACQGVVARVGGGVVYRVRHTHLLLLLLLL